MGKRKRRTDPKSTLSSDVIPHSSQMEESSEQKSSDQVESSAVGSISSIREIMDDSVKLPQDSDLPAHHQRFSRAMLYRNPRYCSRKYYRRNSTNHAVASTSHEEVNPLDVDVFFKLADKYRSDDSSQHTDICGTTFLEPERIRSSSYRTDAVSHGVGKMACGICERPLRKKPHESEGIGSSRDLSVVAVLVCGHVYHADCLELKTCKEAQTDPPCPMCPSLISQSDASIGQE